MNKDFYIITDRSYTFDVTLDQSFDKTRWEDIQKRKYEILAEYLKLPGEKGNDTIIRDRITGEIIFIQRRFLKKITPCPNCGYAGRDYEPS